MVLHALALLLAGFSLFSAALIALIHFKPERYREQPMARLMGLVLMASLAGLQVLNFVLLEYQIDTVQTPLYHALLFTVAPAFYLFSRPLLQPQLNFNFKQWLHFLPVLVAFFLPHSIALPLAFIVGAGYLVWLARSIYALRAQRNRFRLELGALGFIFIIALVVTLLGFSQNWISQALFFELYTCAIGGAFLIISAVLASAPQLPTEVAEAARETYAVSTLTHINCDAVLAQLNQLMENQQLYRDAELDLASLAERLNLSTHQLSELINSRLGKGFSRYLREYRIEAAKQQLIHEPKAAVLAIGLDVGFTSQSNFYEAFREIAGTTPGQYRKIAKSQAPE